MKKLDQRRLRLAKETLRGLGFDELHLVRGGDRPSGGPLTKLVKSRYCND